MMVYVLVFTLKNLPTQLSKATGGCVVLAGDIVVLGRSHIHHVSVVYIRIVVKSAF